MKIEILRISLLLSLAALPTRAYAEWFILEWMEKPPSHGPSTLTNPENVTDFQQALSYSPNASSGRRWQAIRESLKEGDLIAYREGTWKARVEIFFMGRLNKIPYRLFKYGHLAMVVRDPDDENALRLLSSWSFRGPNIGEDLDSLKNHSWEVFRLNQWERVRKKSFYEFIRLVREKAEKWYGYDFLGMLGLWNSNLRPSKPDDIGHDYTCSTLILAALHYAGVELDAHRRHGIADIVTPLQVVSSKGRIVDSPRIDGNLARSPEAVLVASGDEFTDDPSGEIPGDEG